MMDSALTYWQKARKSPYTGDLAIAGIAFAVLRFVPQWLGAWQPALYEAVAVAGAIGLLSVSLDLIPDESD